MLNSELKYYWIALTIEIKTAVLPCREINTKHCHISWFQVILAYFIDFKGILLIIFIDLFSSFYR